MDSLLTMIQFSKNFINPSIDQTGRDIIEEVIQLLANLTMISTDEILIKQKTCSVYSVSSIVSKSLSASKPYVLWDGSIRRL
ncbi:hypothetical protein OL548_34505 (plasmid) [Lysinibacillus sp. MHQ-1]|nr:hypothetical protein OL548_34505 [Lysinibacillus sp. MHQ-1]